MTVRLHRGIFIPVMSMCRQRLLLDISVCQWMFRLLLAANYVSEGKYEYDSECMFWSCVMMNHSLVCYFLELLRGLSWLPHIHELLLEAVDKV